MKSLNRPKVPNCLRKYRRIRGLSQKDVARILRLKSTSTISRWEKGSSLPNTFNVIKLALLYRTMVEGLFIDLRRRLQAELRRREEAALTRKEKNG